VWLTTVGADLTPQTRPVWFIWDATPQSFLIYSQPRAHKVRHIAGTAGGIAFHRGRNRRQLILVFGTARLSDAPGPPAAAMQKYQTECGLDMTPGALAPIIPLRSGCADSARW
jgi:hypothetical protein